MKTFLIVVISFFFSMGAKAQTIEGIGKLKLSMTLNEVKKAFPKSLVKMQTTSKVKKLYKINTYTPIPNHTCKDIRLYFYNDTLYALYVNNAPIKLRESLTLKYGEPVRNMARFRSYVLEQAVVYQDDAADFFNENKVSKWDIVDTYYEWNKGNPFAECFYWELLYENGNKGAAMDCVFYVKNKVLSKAVELEEKLLEVEGKEEKRKGLEGL